MTVTLLIIKLLTNPNGEVKLLSFTHIHNPISFVD